MKRLGRILPLTINVSVGQKQSKQLTHSHTHTGKQHEFSVQVHFRQPEETVVSDET